MAGNHELVILNWNARSLRPHLLELERLLKDHGVDVACITETFLSPGKKIFVPDFTIYRHDRVSGRGGGALIMVRSTITHVQSSISIDGAYAAGVGIKHSTGYLRVIASYILDIFVTKNLSLPLALQNVTALSSDHDPVVMRVTLSTESTPQGRVVTDYLQLAVYLKQSELKTTTILTRGELDRAVSRLTEEIKSATERASKLRSSNPRRTKMPDHVLQQIREE